MKDEVIQSDMLYLWDCQIEEEVAEFVVHTPGTGRLKRAVDSIILPSTTRTSSVHISNQVLWFDSYEAYFHKVQLPRDPTCGIDSSKVGILSILSSSVVYPQYSSVEDLGRGGVVVSWGNSIMTVPLCHIDFHVGFHVRQMVA